MPISILLSLIIIMILGKKKNKLEALILKVYFGPSCFFFVWRQTVVTLMFKKSRSLPKILGARRGTWSKFHTENQQILDTNVQTSVARANWWPVFVHPWYTDYCYLWYVTTSRDRRQKVSDFLVHPVFLNKTRIYKVVLFYSRHVTF